jgi:hypothetical protein
MSGGVLRWRKFSPIDREFPVYELLEGEVVVLDITRDENLGFEIAFHQGASGRVFDLATIERMIAEAKILLEKEEASD